mmetsp:Transcript_6304/g.16332  ORF Transcript_6304/g.16332 Transcript_6304/m.16332 type:complete len:248 (-) Transcript_6304:93-836(-)
MERSCVAFTSRMSATSSRQDLRSTTRRASDARASISYKRCFLCSRVFSASGYAAFSRMSRGSRSRSSGAWMLKETSSSSGSDGVSFAPSPSSRTATRRRYSMRMTRVRSRRMICLSKTSRSWTRCASTFATSVASPRRCARSACARTDRSPFKATISSASHLPASTTRYRATTARLLASAGTSLARRIGSWRTSCCWRIDASRRSSRTRTRTARCFDATLRRSRRSSRQRLERSSRVARWTSACLRR